MEPTQPTNPENQPQSQPVTLARPAGGVTIAGRRFTLPWVIGGVVALMVVLTCGCCGTVTLAAALNSHPTVAAPTATDTAQPYIPPQPTEAQATATPDSSAANYRRFVTLESTVVETDFNGVGTMCAPSHNSVADCRANVQTTHDDVADFLSGLDTHPAPACLHTADTLLRGALADYRQGTQQMLDGLDQNNTSVISQGSATVERGNSEIGQAADAIGAASC